MKDISAIETPAVLVDLDIAECNIDRYQSYCRDHGLALRPHIKTHKLPQLARRQLDAGAVGITCQKIGEAEVMADAGVSDILITYNILGAGKLTRLKALAQRVRLRVVADNDSVIKGLSDTFAKADDALPVLVECDTGAGRCGVQSPQEALSLARKIKALPGLCFAGLMTYPPVGRAVEVQAWLQAALDLLEEAAIPCPIVSNGGTPDMWQAHEIPAATEYRIGTYVYNDRSLMARDLCGPAECALSVLATVVSTPTATRAIIDAGSKILTSDLLGLEGYGMLPDHPHLAVRGLSEEHGELCADSGSHGLTVGDQLRIIPNHACVVSNMVDEVHLIRGQTYEGPCPVAARGKVY